MSEPLDVTPVYRNLKHSSGILGLTPLDLPVMLVPGGVTFLVCLLFGASTLWGLLVCAGVGIGLVVLKWRAPEDVVQLLVHGAFAPRRLSHKERDHMAPFAPFAWFDQRKLRGR